ncbi:hypothetical protein NQ314_007670 [Rhamnusium bicolor]|uniref:Uncharacterized protein n=1 Tax=Rhamnusium bicolor TaxID=1586634 RepID=A0AAV8YIL0_9CUCU|nr:hypothetical protein NQ314_007670 [Rhamnusium bicolor]
MMVLSGTWRIKLNSKSKFLQKTYNVYSVCIQSYFTLFVASLIIELAIVWNQNIGKVFENLGITIFCLVMLMKIRICQSDGIINLVQSLIKFEKSIIETDDKETKKIYNNHAIYTHRINKLVICITYGCVGAPLVIFHLINYIQVENMYKDDVNGTHEKAPLPYVSWFPFDPDKHYFIAFGLDTLAAFLGSTYNSVTQIFFFALMIYVIGRLKMLQLRFRNVHSYSKNISCNVNSDDKLIPETLRNFILEHNSIIE